jgi:hypothetical protein
MATFNSFQIDFTPFGVSDLTQVWQSDDTQVSLGFASEPYHQEGYLMPGPEASPTYVMRAFKTTPTTGHVYWEVEEPDLTGARSGFPPADLTDIVIYHQCCTPNDG